jgi:RNA polymerase sigma-70 factor (ECF subfamily)
MPVDRDRDEFIPTRTSLLSRLKNWDDQESWKEFFDTYWRMLYSVAVKSGLTNAEAQDIVQEAIVAVAKKMPQFKYDPAIGSFKSWLMLIIRRKIIDLARKRQRELPRHAASSPTTETARTATLERVPDPDAGQIDAIYEEEWQQGMLEMAVERVKQKTDLKQFQIFHCYALKSWPVGEVARHFRVTSNQVYVTKHRVSALIKEEIKKLEAKML